MKYRIMLKTRSDPDIAKEKQDKCNYVIARSIKWTKYNFSKRSKRFMILIVMHEPGDSNLFTVLELQKIWKNSSILANISTIP